MKLINSYKYKEREYAEIIFKNGIQTKYVFTELRLLVLYYKEFLNLKPKQRRDKLYEFCEKEIPGYKREKYYKLINKALDAATKKDQKLIQIDSIPIFEEELTYINSLNIDYNFKKVLFTFMIQMKLNKFVYEYKNEKDYNSIFFRGGRTKYNTIKKMANIPQSININSDIIYELNKLGLVTVLHSGLIRLDFIKECHSKGDCKIIIQDFENIGWYLDYFIGVKGVILCGCCGNPFKKTANRQKYCSDKCKKDTWREYDKLKKRENRQLTNVCL